jgi:septum formation inhibitor MinC
MLTGHPDRISALEIQLKAKTTEYAKLSQDHERLSKDHDRVSKQLETLQCEYNESRKIIKLKELAFTFEKRLFEKIFGSMATAKSQCKGKRLNLYLDGVLEKMADFDVKYQRAWDTLWSKNLQQQFENTDTLLTVLKTMKDLRHDTAHLADDEKDRVTKEEELAIIQSIFIHQRKKMCSLLDVYDQKPEDVENELKDCKERMERMLELADLWKKDTLLI